MSIGIVGGASNTSPIVITSMMGPHDLETGDEITLLQTGGNWKANGIWNVTVIDALHFSLDGSDGSIANGNGVYTLCGQWRTNDGPNYNLTDIIAEGYDPTINDIGYSSNCVVRCGGHGFETGNMVYFAYVQFDARNFQGETRKVERIDDDTYRVFHSDGVTLVQWTADIEHPNFGTCWRIG